MSDALRSPSDQAVVALSVIVPAFNEVETIGRTVGRVLAFLDAQSYRSELIVVLDGGRAGAAEAIAAVAGPRETVPGFGNVQNRGEGVSVGRGTPAPPGRAGLFVAAGLP